MEAHSQGPSSLRFWARKAWSKAWNNRSMYPALVTTTITKRSHFTERSNRPTFKLMHKNFWSVKLFSFYTVCILTHIVQKNMKLIVLSKYNAVKNELLKTKFSRDYVCQAISFRGAKAWMSGCYRLERRASDNIFACLYYRIWCALDQEQRNSKSLSGRLLVV